MSLRAFFVSNYNRWSGENFSSRIWTDKRKLSKVIKTTIESGIHQGLDIKEMSKRINDVMSSGYNNAVRLVRTEMNFVNNSATYDALDEVGILYYEFIAVLDNRTSKMCQSRDGEVYPMSEKSVGFNYPPLHPRCRSTVAPYIEGTGRLGSRIAKVNGKRLHVPESMTYKEFSEKYLGKTLTNDNKYIIINNTNTYGSIEESIKSVSLSRRQISLRDKEDLAFKSQTDSNFGFKKNKQEPNYVEEAIKVNGNKAGKMKERLMNCQRCAVALEARMRGYDVIARPSWGDNDTMIRAGNWLAAFDYDPSKIRKCSGKNFEDIIKSITDQMKSYGEGSRGLVVFKWQEWYRKDGHVISVQTNSSGKVIFVDPQDGSRAAISKLKMAKLDEIYILRVDNLNFTEVVKRCCVNRGEDL